MSPGDYNCSQANLPNDCLFVTQESDEAYSGNICDQNLSFICTYTFDSAPEIVVIQADPFTEMDISP